MIPISEKNPHNYPMIFYKAAIWGALQDLDFTSMDYYIKEFNKAEAKAKIWEITNEISEKGDSA